MDTNILVAEAKARFNHNLAKTYLSEKFDSKLILASQGGLWKADTQTISFLNTINIDTVVLVDTFNNPVKVNRVELLSELISVYNSVMEEWYNEWKELEGKR
jgi:hypothetical protein